MYNILTKRIFIAVLFLLIPVFSFAQDIPYALNKELNVDIIPNYPRPNELVFLSLSLYTDDLSTAEIFWYKDGKLESSGKGQTKYSFKAGDVGNNTKIDINIKLLSGISFSRHLEFNPASVDLSWEANSYVPPFYKGKTLHPRQGVIKIVAMPEFVKNGVRTSPKDLVYEWSNDVETYQNQSGYGKNVVFLNGSILGKNENFRVLVTDPVNNLVAEAFINVNPIQPEIVFYENNPFYGYIFDKALSGNFKMKSSEIQIVSTPFYFTKEDLSELNYTWLLNGNDAPDLFGSKMAVFKKPEGKSGQSSIFLRVENNNRILQQAENRLSVGFDK